MTNCKVVPCDLKEGRRGMLYYAINYVAKKYTDKDHPRSAKDFAYLIISMFGMDENGEEIDINQKTITRYLDFLESYSNLIPRFGREDRFEAVIRTMMGGRINHVGTSPVLYYFSSDGDEYKSSKENLEASVTDIADSFFYNEAISLTDSFRPGMQDNFEGITEVMKGE